MTWTVKFEVALTTDPGDEPGVWTDLTSRVRTPSPVEGSAGAGRLVDDDGELSLTLDNYDRLIDPTNPDVTVDVLLRHARQTAIVNGNTFPLFRGLVDKWTPEWSDVDSSVHVTVVDGFAWLGLQDADLDLPRQMTHARITAILDLAGWPAGLRDIADGVIEVEPYEQAQGNLLRVLRDTAEAEDGDLFVAPDGKITFRSRHARFNAPTALTFGPGGIPFGGAEPAIDTTKVTNTARVELADGRVFEAIAGPSVTRYGARIDSIRDLSLRDAEAVALAQWTTVRFSVPRLWVDDLTVDGADSADDTILEDLLGLRIGKKVRVLHTAIEGGTVDVFLCVERIRFQIEPNEWIATLDLSPYFGEGPWFTWDDPALGWDSGAVWAP